MKSRLGVGEPVGESDFTVTEICHGSMDKKDIVTFLPRRSLLNFLTVNLNGRAPRRRSTLGWAAATHKDKTKIVLCWIWFWRSFALLRCFLVSQHFLRCPCLGCRLVYNGLQPNFHSPSQAQDPYLSRKDQNFWGWPFQSHRRQWQRNRFSGIPSHQLTPTLLRTASVPNKRHMYGWPGRDEASCELKRTFWIKFTLMCI